MSIPKEPRQLMINLMYLVLTAMLALNVSAEIINAFFLIDRGITGSNNVFDTSNASTFDVLSKNAEQDLSKYQKLVDAAKEVSAISKEFHTYVDDLREGMVKETDGYYPADDKDHPGFPKGYKNKDVTTRVLVEEGKGEELKARILADRAKITAIVNKLKGAEGTGIDEASLADLEKRIQLSVSDEWENAKPKRPNWSAFTFNHMPLASVFPIMRKFQNDMKSSEAAVLNFLSDQVGKQTFKVDAFIPIASAKKAYVISGEQFEAEVTVGASSKSVYENMSIRVNGSPQKVENGIAKYTTSTNSTGVQKYKVDITLTNPTTQKAETYSKEFEYEVGRRSVTVSADKMNVLYIGVDNPISVAAAGVSSNDLRVSASGAGINLRGGNGKYTATVSQPGEANISVSGGGLTNSRFNFRVKRIPDPVARLSKSSGGGMGTGEFKAQGGVGAFLDNFDFEAVCVIQGFNLVYVPKRQDAVPVVNPGARYNDRARELVSRAKPGDIYYFENVKAKCPGDQAGREINSMVFTIK